MVGLFLLLMRDRMRIHKYIEELNCAVLSRLRASAGSRCLTFPSLACANRFLKYLASETNAHTSQSTEFGLAGDLPETIDASKAIWAPFVAVIYSGDEDNHGFHFWRQGGDGITSRHACYALSLFDHLVPTKNTEPSATLDSEVDLPDRRGSAFGENEKRALRSSIATLASSEKGGRIAAEDVLLYPCGMNAIYSVSRALRRMSKDDCDAVAIYGCVRRSSAAAQTD
jgi:hypothetical protein